MTLAELRKRRGEAIEPAHEEAHAEHHPGALEYIQIGLILGVITAVEVALYYVDMDHTLLVVILVLLSIAKFSLVVLWFMHLKFDNKLFSTLFATGLFGTMILFAIVLAAERGKFV